MEPTVKVPKIEALGKSNFMLDNGISIAFARGILEDENVEHVDIYVSGRHHGTMWSDDTSVYEWKALLSDLELDGNSWQATYTEIDKRVAKALIGKTPVYMVEMDGLVTEITTIKEVCAVSQTTKLGIKQ